jgi:hypothetical protein
MSHKVKSSLYFASLMLTVLTYYTISTNDTIQNNELAQNTIEQVSTDKTVH